MVPSRINEPSTDTVIEYDTTTSWRCYTYRLFHSICKKVIIAGSQRIPYKLLDGNHDIVQLESRTIYSYPYTPRCYLCW